jgi:hypothetical protein
LCVPFSKSPSHMLCINRGGRWISWWPFSPPHGRNLINTKKRHRGGHACQATMSNELMAILITRICKTWCTSTQRGYGIWWYEPGHGKFKWKASMIYIYICAIHARSKKRGENNNVGDITTPITNDYLWTKHVNQWQTNPTFIT